MSVLLSRSPCIIEINDVNLESAYIYLFIAKEGQVITVPQYTLSKLTPASNVDSVYFDISPYVNEYITNSTFGYYSVFETNLPIEHYCAIDVHKYKIVAGVNTFINIERFYCFKGYMEQANGIDQNSNGNFLLDQMSYQYHYESGVTLIQPGDITCYLLTSYVVKYTNLVTGLSQSRSVTTNGFKKIFKVYPSYISDGNKVEIFNGATLLASYTFTPTGECRYSPVTIDFINRYGAWQREFLFKNSINSINTEGLSYKNYRAIQNVFNPQENLVTTFNTNGNESIKCNTGWVDETFNTILKQILLSDRILINNNPATITTKQVELQKNINNKLINYSLDFQFTNAII